MKISAGVWTTRLLCQQVSQLADDTVTHPTLALDLAQAGAVQAVLPTFIGNRIAGVDRSGGIIDALTHD